MKKLKMIFFTLFLVALSTSAFAALSLDQQAAVDATTVLVTDLTAMAWTFVLSVMGALVAIKLFKKFFGRSTS